MFVPGVGVTAWAARGGMVAAKAFRAVKVVPKVVGAIRNGNNILRIGPSKGIFRISAGPAPSRYGNGKFGSKIPFHFHIDRTKILLQNSKTSKMWYCKGKCRKW
jgi:hypothetical protein